MPPDSTYFHIVSKQYQILYVGGGVFEKILCAYTKLIISHENKGLKENLKVNYVVLKIYRIRKSFTLTIVL